MLNLFHASLFHDAEYGLFTYVRVYFVRITEESKVDRTRVIVIPLAGVSNLGQRLSQNFSDILPINEPMILQTVKLEI